MSELFIAVDAAEAGKPPPHTPQLKAVRVGDGLGLQNSGSFVSEPHAKPACLLAYCLDRDFT